MRHGRDSPSGSRPCTPRSVHGSAACALPALLRPELSAGALLQVNVCSLLGRHGLEAREGAVRLVRVGDAYVLASDGHGSHNRAHTLAAGPAAARAAGVSPLRGEQLTRANPRFLLRNGIPRGPRPDERTQRQSRRRRRAGAALATAHNRR